MPDKVYKEAFGSWEDVRSNFELPKDTPEPSRIFAVYDTPPYEGDATVVFQRDGQWFQTNGSHCSCRGLEDQWAPEPIDLGVYREATAAGKRLVSMPGAYQAEFDEWFAGQIGGAA